MTTTLLAYIPSPAQGVWHLGFLPIRAYALCIITGIIAALVLGDRRWVARGGQPGVIYDIALWAVPFGLIGGRLYHIMTDWPTYFGDNGAGFLAALRIWDGGLGIWGAVALGGVGAWIACRRREIPLPAFGDAIAPGIVLAQAIGRLGNYFNQELWGRATTLPWGLEIYERRDANGALDTLNGVSTGQLVGVVHPTFLYELLWNLLVFALLIWVDRRYKLGHGRLFALYVAAYCVGRFWIELMRSDHATEFGGIRVNSFTSTFVFIGAVIYIMVATKGREDPASLVGKGFDDDDEDAKSAVPKKVAAVAGAAGAVAAASAVADKDDGAENTSDSPDEPAGEEADAVTESEPEASDPEAEGLGAVDGGEVAAAVEDAPEVHAAVVEETAAAEELEGDAAEAAEKTDAVDAEEGLGSVDGDEVAAAVQDAPEVHASAVEDSVAADDLETEAEEAADATDDASAAEETPAVADEAEPADDAETDADELVDADEGIGSVEGDEVAAAVEDAPEVHATAVEEVAEAESVEGDAADVASEPESEPEPASDSDAEEGLGAVEGDEVAAAVTAAPKIHAAAARGASAAEALGADVEAEDGEPAAESEAEAAKDGDTE